MQLIEDQYEGTTGMHQGGQRVINRRREYT